MRHLTRALLVVVCAGLAACLRQAEPRPLVAASVPAETPAPAGVLAEAKADLPHLTVQVVEVKRSGPDTLTVTLVMMNTGGPGETLRLATSFAADPRDQGTVADMSLLDDTGSRKFFVLRDNENRPVGSTDLADLAGGERRHVRAAFPAPPAGVGRITICLPHVPPIANVPIS